MSKPPSNISSLTPSRWRVVQVLVLALTLLFLHLHASAQSYRIIDLGTLGGAESSAKGINEKNTVVGWSYTSGMSGKAAFLWRPETGMTNLGSLGGDREARAVNNFDQVVGNSGITPFLWQNGVMTSLGITRTADAADINDAGNVVGAIYSPSIRAFLWQSGITATLPGAGNIVVATTINERGNVGGFLNLSGGDRRLAIWYGGTNLLYSEFQGESGKMNNLDWIAGHRGGTACVWRITNVVDFGSGSATDVNDAGQAVGELQFPGQPNRRAFLWRDDDSNSTAETNEVRDLNSLIPPGSGWVLTAAYGINNLGSIVGEGDYQGQRRAFLLIRKPVIVTHPSNQSVLLGGNAIFQALAAGTGPVSYQWLLNTTNVLVEQTNSTLILSNVQYFSVGSYSVVASDADGSVVSSNALLTVVLPGNDDDGDGLTNELEIQFGTDPLSQSTDGDTLNDYDELFVHGTNPLLADTDGDGMQDGWEVQHGLNPRVNDTTEDADFDGLTNFQEYQYSLGHTNQLDPKRLFSQPGVSDYFVFTGGQTTNSMFYDRIDRLIGLESSRGVSLAYQYDGNGNIVRQTVLSRAAETNGLPVLWSFLNRLPNSAGRYGDNDGDGWSNYQEWKAGSHPTNRLDVPKPGSAPQTAPLAQVLPAGTLLSGLARVPVRLWDAEGNASRPELQFQWQGSSNWADAAVIKVDGFPYSASTRVEAPPTGFDHVLWWNAASDLGASPSTNVYLRARATDVSLAGVWSQPVLYPAQVSADADADGDGVADLQELANGTNPFIANPPSLGQPSFSAGDRRFHAIVNGFPGGRYTVEASTNLIDWTAVGTVSTTNSPAPFQDPSASDFGWRFYRVRGG